jgi:2-oxoglutarate ferredoxin oxidoreductase subunit alpha
VLGWGSSYGAILAGVRRVRATGKKVARIHLRHLNPFPANLGAALAGYRRILVPELNRGQLVRMVRSEFLVDAISYPKVQGQPFKAAEIEAKLLEII